MNSDIKGQTEPTISLNTAIDKQKQKQTLMEDLELSDSSTSDSEQQYNWRFINNDCIPRSTSSTSTICQDENPTF